MLYVDYQWDLTPTRILLDEELNVEKLGWKPNDYFRIEQVNGRTLLVKVDPVTQFIKEGENK